MKQRAWHIFLYGKEINIVYYDIDCDANYVYSGLVNHDGFHPAIKIYPRKIR